MCRRIVRTARPALPFAAVCAGLLLAGSPARAGLSQVPDLFAAASWEHARAQAVGDDSGARPAEAVMWRSRLAADPAAALALLQEGLGQRRLARPLRARLALEAADLELGRGRPAEALAVLAPLADDGDAVPGAVPVTAARALLALGRGSRAREMLAGVRSSDPAYGLSRALLGDIALSQGDGTGALGWYDAADQADAALRHRTVSGRCRALLRAGRAAEAQALADRIAGQDPGSLALVEMRRALREHAADRPGAQAAWDGDPVGSPAGNRAAGRASPPAEPEPAPAPEPDRAPPPRDVPAAGAGRYTLQFGAFSDRARAREFRSRVGAGIPGLVIEEGRDARGQVVYRARAGTWEDEDEAGRAARALGAKLGLDVIVVDRQAPARAGG